tara:strand:+ start:253 stop:528 length:276 start_codon:yes stop_codon:yes gene_type:complete
MLNKLNSLRFGIAGALVTGFFVLIVDIFLWLKYAALYNSLLINVYGVSGLTILDLIKILLGSVIIGFIVGLVLFWLFAWIYNKLLLIKIRE